MSIWSRITEALSALTAGEGLSAVFDRLRTPPERSVAFTIAVIALGAKMAKADGPDAPNTRACPNCGVEGHRTDAVHCHACGETLHATDV